MSPKAGVRISVQRLPDKNRALQRRSPDRREGGDLQSKYYPQSREWLRKAEECKLDITSTSNYSIAYRQAHTIIECKKMYKQQLTVESFIDKSVLDFYPNNDFHYMYVAEISNCFVRN